MDDDHTPPSALTRSELEALFEAAPVGMAVFDEDKRYRWVNPALARMNRRDAADHRGRRPRELLSMGDEVEASIGQVLAGAPTPLVQTLEGARTTDSGIHRRYRVSYWPLHRPDGGVEAVGSMVLDVTEHAETELAFHEIEAGYRAVIDAANDAILIADVQTGVILDVNQSAARLLGRSVEELVGIHQRELHPDQEPERYQQIFEEHATSGGVITSGLHIQHSSGRIVPVEISGSPMRYRGRQAVLGLFRDVTERRRHQEMLERANEELLKLDEMKNNLLANVSHELRSPLVGIRGYVELLRGEKPPARTQRKWLDRILRNIARLERIIDGLLQMTALQAGLWPSQSQPVPVSRLVNAALTTVRLQARNAGIHLVVEIPPDLPAVQGDETQITSVIINLLENAIKFSPAGAEVRLTAARADPGGVRFRVTDQGVGIAPEHRDQIFDRFYQADSSSTRAYGGFGVGLAIVKEVIDAHGGRIEVQSAPGEGTLIEVALPEAPARDSHPPGPGEDDGTDPSEPAPA